MSPILSSEGLRLYLVVRYMELKKESPALIFLTPVLPGPRVSLRRPVLVLSICVAMSSDLSIVRGYCSVRNGDLDPMLEVI